MGANKKHELSQLGPALDRRSHILKTADELFLKEGYQAVSMSAIAAKIGGSKGTLYNYFSSKEELFAENVARHCKELQSQMSLLIEDGKGLRDTLHSMGRRYLEVVASEEFVRKVRMVLAEAERSPGLAQTFYETGPERGASIVAAYFQNAREQGALVLDNPLRAARHFLSLCDNGFVKARWCNARPEPTAAEIDAEVADAVRIFLAAYGA